MPHGRGAADPTQAAVALRVGLAPRAARLYRRAVTARSLVLRLVMTVVIAAATVAGCASTPSCPAVAPRAPGPPLVWKATRAGAAPVWLFGTIHVLGADDVPAGVWAAITAAPRVATELGAEAPPPELLAELARLPRGKGLDARLAADDWYDLALYLDGVIRAEQLKRARPWYALSLVTRKAAPGPSPTMDEAIAQRARAAGVEVTALETWRDQLTTVDAGVTVDDLRDALHARKTMRCDVAAIATAYRAGDADELAVRLAVAASARLLVERNRRWVPAIEALADGGGGVVAVGLSHLLGDDSLPALLTARGFTVERVAP